jgi:REP element-mobilizing transposase RayT
MSDEKFQNKYRIPSGRAPWHDYSGGAYFITVCTQNHEHFFGEIECTLQNEPQMQLTPIGQCLYEKLQNITTHCPYAEIPLFVVMPNHWHAIVFVDGEKIPYQRRNMEMWCDAHVVRCRDGACPVSTQAQTEMTINEKMQQIDALKGWLSVAIGGIKSSVTKFANKNSIDFAWQTRFDDRIIRNQNEMNRIADYIEHNVARWEIDCFNKNEECNLRMP